MSGTTYGMLSAVNCGPRLGVEVLEDLDRLLDRVEVEAGLLLDDRQAVVLDVFEVVLDQDPDDVAVRRLGRELQQQALLVVAGADAGRVELLHDAPAPSSTSLERQRLASIGRRRCPHSGVVTGSRVVDVRDEIAR